MVADAREETSFSARRTILIYRQANLVYPVSALDKSCHVPVEAGLNRRILIAHERRTLLLLPVIRPPSSVPHPPPDRIITKSVL
jgi:hypothetical protein